MRSHDELRPADFVVLQALQAFGNPCKTIRKDFYSVRLERHGVISEARAFSCSAETYHDLAGLQPFRQMGIQFGADMPVMRYMDVSHRLNNLLVVPLLLELRGDQVRENDNKHASGREHFIRKRFRVRV